MDAKELMKKVEEQELRLQFDAFNSDMALEIGGELIAEAKRRNGKICVDISAFGRCLFHFSSNECEMRNEVWIERKRNTALYSGHSSLWVHYYLESIGKSIEEAWNLPLSEYAQVGGAFPIRVKGCEGILGTIIISSFPHEEDHEIIVGVLEKYLGK